MDFILRKIENKLQLSDPGSYEYITLLRTQIEYSLFLCIGYLWKYIGDLSQEKRTRIFSELNNLSIGSAVNIIRMLNAQSCEEIISKKCANILDTYPAIRNSKLGHGYVMAEAIASELLPLFTDMVSQIPLLNEECDLIIVKSVDAKSGIYNGIRFPSDKNGSGIKWSCPIELFDTSETEFPRTYIVYKGKYNKISPFVFMDDNNYSPSIFSSLTEKIVGKTKMSPLFPSFVGESTIEIIFKELVQLSKTDGYRLFSGSNGTIMNKFTPNYTQYIDVGFLSLIQRFLNSNRAYVTATIWGHGGVGKTACVQALCYNLFNDTKRKFSYIVFITAKDRVYNTKTGKIDSYTGNIHLYSEVIEVIAKTVFDFNDTLSGNPELLVEYERKISEFEDQLLIVIDDYETFEDCEKEKVSAFLNSLNARYHKAIITTRNKRFVIGENIPSNELDLLSTKCFIEAVIKSEYNSHLLNIQALLADEPTLKRIHIATSGRPIFIYQFIHLYVQNGYQADFIEGIRTSHDAQEFLYGRIVQYLSLSAQQIFSTISVIVDSDLQFKIDVLRHVLSKAIPEKEQFESSLEEILNQKVVERINDNYGRVYSPELKENMQARYQEYPIEFQNTVKNLLDSIGGKDIKVGILEAMLEQADKSRALGNEVQTVEKYRRVLNDKTCPQIIRKLAIKHLAYYFSNDRLNPSAAISVIEEYLSFFSDDVDIYTLYVYMLWAQGPEEKEKAVKVIRSFFSDVKHKKTSPKYLSFFSLGVGYCIGYDLQYRVYTNSQLRKAQLLNTYNEYGKELFDHISQDKILKGKAALFHNIRVALIQTIKLCYVLSEYEKSANKARYGLTICAWMRTPDLKEPFTSQIKKWDFELKRVVANQYTDRSVMDQDFYQLHMNVDLAKPEEEPDGFISKSGDHCLGDIVDVKITGIQPYGVFAEIDTTVGGLIHISEIADRYISNIYNEFKIGEVCSAKIIKIDKATNKISLSTKGLRKENMYIGVTEIVE